MDIDLMQLKFNEEGLIPAIIQSEISGEVLMLAYMNQESIRLTLEKGYTHFYSRSRKRIWFKGETSGHTQRVKEIRYDCDGDTLLLLVHQSGVPCHTGAPSCFQYSLYGKGVTGIISSLFRLIEDRRQNPKESSYTNKLFLKGKEGILKKVGEESCEVILAGMKGDREEMIREMADLTYHLLVLMSHESLSPYDVEKELWQRFHGVK